MAESAPRGEVRPKIDAAAVLRTVDIVEVVERYLPLRREGAEFVALCPFHNESSPSFKVSKSKQFFQCFGCGAHGDAIQFVREYEGVGFRQAVEILTGGTHLPVARPDPAPAPPREPPKPEWTPILPVPDNALRPPHGHPHRGRPDATYTYRDRAGRLLGYTYRFTTSGGGKEVLPFVWAENGQRERMWRQLSFPVPRPLYGLDRLRDVGPVLLVEGEKCADVGRAQLKGALQVLTWPGGGKAVDKVDWTPLAGRTIYLWADCDAKREKLSRAEAAAGVDKASKPLLPEAEQPGVKAARAIARHLLALDPPAEVFMVAIPAPGAVADGWDIADAVDEGLVGEALRARILSAVRFEAPPEPVAKPAPPESRATVADAGAGESASLPPEPPAGAGGEGDARPEVRIGGDRLVSAVREAEALLLQARPEALFERGGTLWRLGEPDRPRSAGVERDPAGAVLLPVNKEWLRVQFQEVARFMSWNQRAEVWKPANLPKEYPEAYIEGGHWQVPVLRAVVEAPVLMPDGSILSTRGYDAASELYLHSSLDWELPDLCDAAGRYDVAKEEIGISWALAQFRDLFMPFSPGSDADFSAMVAMVLTGLVKVRVGLSPGFFITAPVAGSGKGLLASLVSIICTGRPVKLRAMKEDEREFEASLFTAMVEGESIIAIDEVKGPLNSSVLNSMMTASVYTDRIKGFHRSATVRPADVLFLATANNGQVHGDGHRRWICVYLDPRCESPEKRDFERDAEAFALQHRRTLVKAALTLLQGYVLAGKPPQGVVQGSYRAWAELVPSCLVWAGLPNPCDTMARWLDYDDRRRGIGALFEAWHEEFGEFPQTSKELCEFAEANRNSELFEILNDEYFDPKMGKINPRRLGNSLKAIANRVENGLKIVNTGLTKQRYVLWKLVKAQKESRSE